MATAVIFMEVPEWSWHYNLALDTLDLVVHSSFRLYIFFRRPFSVPVVSWRFDPRHSYVDFPLRLAHLPHFPEPAPSASSMEIDPSKGSSPHPVVHVAESGSSSASTEVLSKMQLDEDPRSPCWRTGSTLRRLGF